MKIKDLETDYVDIKLIVELLSDQEPGKRDLIEKVKRMMPLRFLRNKYVHFVDRSNPNQPGAEWQFGENIVLEHPEEGTLIIDVLKDGRLGGIEFYTLLD